MIIRHLGGQAHNITVVLEGAEPDNEKAVIRIYICMCMHTYIDQKCDKNKKVLNIKYVKY